MIKRRQALDAKTVRAWADMAHVFFIDALAGATPLSVDKVAFHGGTNLHLSWGSPRFSEDLDFLVTRDFGARIRALIPQVQRRMQHLASAEWPGLKVEIRDKTRNPDGLLNFNVVFSAPDVVGNVMAKAEFWQVEPEYLAGFSTQFRQPAPPSSGTPMQARLSQPLPSATLEAAFADKVVALANRPHIKWRDIFDLWWIRGQAAIMPEDEIDRVLHHATCYRAPDGVAGPEALSERLGRFMAQPRDTLIEGTRADLGRWLPTNLWTALETQGVEAMVDTTLETLARVRAELPTVETNKGCDDANPGP